MGTARSGPFHSAATIREMGLCWGVRGRSCTPQSLTCPWPVCQLIRAPTGSREQRTERLGSMIACPHPATSRWRWLVPSHGCGLQRFRSRALPSSAPGLAPAPAQRPWCFPIAHWCRSRAHSPVMAPSLDSPPWDICDPSRPHWAQRATSLSPTNHHPQATAQDTAQWPSLTRRLDGNSRRPQGESAGTLGIWPPLPQSAC